MEYNLQHSKIVDKNMHYNDQASFLQMGTISVQF